MQEKNETPQAYVCPECEENFPESNDLFEHLRDIHFNEKNKPTAEDGILKFNGVPPKYVVEGVLAGVLAEMHNTISSILEWESEKITKLAAFKSVVYIWAIEMNGINSTLKDVNPKTLCPKHRMIQSLAPLWFIQLTSLSENIKSAKRDNEASIITAVSQMLEMAQLFHAIMNDRTPKKHRKEIYDAAMAASNFVVGNA